MTKEISHDLLERIKGGKISADDESFLKSLGNKEINNILESLKKTGLKAQESKEYRQRIQVLLRKVDPKAIKDAVSLMNKTQYSQERALHKIPSLENSFKPGVVPTNLYAQHVNPLQAVNVELVNKVLNPFIDFISKHPETSMLLTGIRASGEYGKQKIGDTINKIITSPKPGALGGFKRDFNVDFMKIRNVLEHRGYNIPSASPENVEQIVKDFISKTPEAGEETFGDEEEKLVESIMRILPKQIQDDIIDNVGEEHKYTALRGLLYQVRHLVSSTIASTEGYGIEPRALGHTIVTAFRSYFTDTTGEIKHVQIAKKLRGIKDLDITSEKAVAEHLAKSMGGGVTPEDISKSLNIPRIVEYANMGAEKIDQILFDQIKPLTDILNIPYDMKHSNIDAVVTNSLLAILRELGGRSKPRIQDTTAHLKKQFGDSLGKELSTLNRQDYTAPDTSYDKVMKAYDEFISHETVPQELFDALGVGDKEQYDTLISVRDALADKIYQGKHTQEDLRKYKDIATDIDAQFEKTGAYDTIKTRAGIPKGKDIPKVAKTALSYGRATKGREVKGTGERADIVWQKYIAIEKALDSEILKMRNEQSPLTKGDSPKVARRGEIANKVKEHVSKYFKGELEPHIAELVENNLIKGAKSEEEFYSRQSSDDLIDIADRKIFNVEMSDQPDKKENLESYEPIYEAVQDVTDQIDKIVGGIGEQNKENAIKFGQQYLPKIDIGKKAQTNLSDFDDFNYEEFYRDWTSIHAPHLQELISNKMMDAYDESHMPVYQAPKIDLSNIAQVSTDAIQTIKNINKKVEDEALSIIPSRQTTHDVPDISKIADIAKSAGGTGLQTIDTTMIEWVLPEVDYIYPDLDWVIPDISPEVVTKHYDQIADSVSSGMQLLEDVINEPVPRPKYDHFTHPFSANWDFEMDMPNDEILNSYFARSTSALFTSVDVASQIAKQFRKGGRITSQQLHARRGYDQIYDQGATGAQYSIPLQKYGAKEREKIGTGFHDLIQSQLTPLKSSNNANLVNQALAEQTLKLSGLSDFTPDEFISIIDSTIGKSDPELAAKMKGAISEGEYYADIGEMKKGDLTTVLKSEEIANKIDQGEKLKNVIGKTRQFSVELNMSMLGLMFSALSFIGILTQGIGKLLAPYQDLAATFKSMGMALAFGGDNTKRFAKGVDPSKIIKGWMDLQGIVAGLHLMLSNLGTQLLDSGFFDILDQAIGDLGDTLTKPQNVELFANLIEKLVQAIPSVIRSLEIALKILTWIEKTVSSFGANIFAIIASAGLIGTIFLPIFAIINAFMQAMQFAIGTLVIGTFQWYQQLKMVESTWRRIAEFSHLVKYNLAKTGALLLTASLGMRALQGLGDTDSDQQISRIIQGKEDEGFLAGIFKLENILNILLNTLMLAGSVMIVLDIFRNVKLADISATLKAWFAVDKLNNLKSRIWQFLQSKFLTLQTSLLSGILANTTLLALGLGVLITAISALLLGSNKTKPDTFLTFDYKSGEVTHTINDGFISKDDKVIKLNPSDNINDGFISKDGKVIKLNPSDNIAAFKSLSGGEDEANILSEIAKNTKETSEKTGLVNRAISYLGWSGFESKTSGSAFVSDESNQGIFGRIGDAFRNIWESIREFLEVPEDKSFWGWLWDGIVNFIGDPIGGTFNLFEYTWGLLRKLVGVPEDETLLGYAWGVIKGWLGKDSSVVSFVEMVYDKLTEILGVPEDTGILQFIFDTAKEIVLGEKSPGEFLSEAWSRLMVMLGNTEDTTVMDYASVKINELFDRLVEHVINTLPGGKSVAGTVGFIGGAVDKGMDILSSIFGGRQEEEVVKILDNTTQHYDNLIQSIDEVCDVTDIVTKDISGMNMSVTSDIGSMENNVIAGTKNSADKITDFVDHTDNEMDKMNINTKAQMDLFVMYVNTAIQRAVAQARAAASAGGSSLAME